MLNDGTSSAEPQHFTSGGLRSGMSSSVVVSFYEKSLKTPIAFIMCLNIFTTLIGSNVVIVPSLRETI